MKAVIGRYYKKLKDAEKYAESMRKMWKGRIAFYVFCYDKGYLVISESAARACFPDLKFSFKDRKYNQEK